MELTYTEHPGRHVADITLYALSYCPYCNETKKYLNDHDIEYRYINVDELTGAEAQLALETVEKYNPHDTFPTLVINGGHQIIIGYQPDALDKLISASHWAPQAANA